MLSLPLLVTTHELADQLGQPGLRVVDLSRSAIHRQTHLPGAVPLDFRRLQLGAPSAPGLLPSPGSIATLMAQLGITPDVQVVAYDDEGGGWASRLLWLLQSVGHTRYSLLDGGIHAWLQAGLPTADGVGICPPVVEHDWQLNDSASVSLEWLLEHHRDDEVVLWDARSQDEYEGVRVYANRGGHIPGAVHYEWTRLMDAGNRLRLRPREDLHAELAALGVTSPRRVVTYCQTHHRSSLCWLVGRLLNLDIVAYPGSWAEWGNLPETPVENPQYV